MLFSPGESNQECTGTTSMVQILLVPLQQLCLILMSPIRYVYDLDETSYFIDFHQSNHCMKEFCNSGWKYLSQMEDIFSQEGATDAGVFLQSNDCIFFIGLAKQYGKCNALDIITTNIVATNIQYVFTQSLIPIYIYSKLFATQQLISTNMSIGDK